MERNRYTNEHRQSLRTEIVCAAMSEFMSKGVRAVRMDDIAQKLRISKRTLYEVFSNKEELLLETVRIQDNNYTTHMLEFSNAPTHNVIDIIIEFYNLQMNWWANCNLEYFEDLQRYRKVKEFFMQKEEMRHRDGEVFFKRGVDEGIFLADVDYLVFIQIANASMEYIKKHRFFVEYGMEHMVRNVILFYIRGICTNRGIALLDAKFGVEG